MPYWFCSTLTNSGQILASKFICYFRWSKIYKNENVKLTFADKVASHMTLHHGVKNFTHELLWSHLELENISYLLWDLHECLLILCWVLLLEQITSLCFHLILSLLLELDGLDSGLWNTCLDTKFVGSLSCLLWAVIVLRFRASGTIDWLWELGNGGPFSLF